MTDDPTSVGDKRCSSHLQRLGRKNVVKSSRIAAAVKEVEGKPALVGFKHHLGLSLYKVEGSTLKSILFLNLQVKVPDTENLSFSGIGIVSQIHPVKSEPYFSSSFTSTVHFPGVFFTG